MTPTESGIGGPRMRVEDQEILLRIFVSESVHDGPKPLYESIVLEARRLHLKGATAFRGMLGFGAHLHIRSAQHFSLTDDLPIIIEIVDTEDQIAKLVPFIEARMDEGVLTSENVRVIKYSSR